MNNRFTTLCALCDQYDATCRFRGRWLHPDTGEFEYGSICDKCKEFVDAKRAAEVGK